MSATAAQASHRLGFAAVLSAAAAPLGISLSSLQIDRLLDFLGLLDRWNRTYNLTAVRDPAAMLIQHVVDCLAVVGPLRRHLLTAPDASRVLDVGSGGGLPGIVLAIMEPALAVTCVDRVGKKAAFIQQAASTLELPNLTARHSRVEDIGEHYEIVMSRAFASLAVFVDSTRSKLCDGGVWMAMKGRVPDEEIADLPSDIDVFHVEPLAIPELEAERCIVWMRRRVVDPETRAASKGPHSSERPTGNGKA